MQDPEVIIRINNLHYSVLYSEESCDVCSSTSPERDRGSLAVKTTRAYPTPSSKSSIRTS